MQMMAGMGGGGGMGGMGGMPGMGGGGDPAQMESQQRKSEHDAKNTGKENEEAGFAWEQTSSGGESEILIRFALEKPATKKDVKVTFTATSLSVTVAGVEMLNGKTFSKTHADESTWCLIDKGAELQVLLCSASDTKWDTLLEAK